MTPAPRKATPPPCGYPIGETTCGQPATEQLPVGYASNVDPIPLCEVHALRFLGAAQNLPPE